MPPPPAEYPTMPGKERRDRHRVITRRHVRCRSILATGSRSPFRAETIDISSGGIGLLVAVRVRPGTPMTVELRFNEPKLDLSLDGVVMHSVPMAGRWFAGVRFVGIGLAKELELSQFVLREEQLARANRTWLEEPAELGVRGFRHHSADRLAAAS